MKPVLTATLLIWPAFAGAQQGAALSADYTGEDLSYCAGLFATLRTLDPGMVSVISPQVDTYLRAEAGNRTSKWSLGVPLKRAEMRGAADARALMDRKGLLDFGTASSGPQGAGGGLARCWTMVEPLLRPAK